jgi:hypothetical protein
LKPKKEISLKNVSKIGVGSFIFICILTIGGMGSALAEDSSKNITRWRGGPQIGLSPYTGLIGAELQKRHWGVTIGFPGNIGVRYYLNETGDRWFFGFHAALLNIDEDETEDGIRYKKQKFTFLGSGAGYKWRWLDSWELTLNLSIEYVKQELENDSTTKTDEYISVDPGIAIGYSF